jgi:hypothetical protein
MEATKLMTNAAPRPNQWCRLKVISGSMWKAATIVGAARSCSGVFDFFLSMNFLLHGKTIQEIPQQNTYRDMLPLPSAASVPDLFA